MDTEVESEEEDDIDFFDAMDILPPQDIPDKVQNNTGVAVHKVTDLNRALRFLCIGNENGSYYVKPDKLKEEAVQSIDRYVVCFKSHWGRARSSYIKVYNRRAT